MIRRWIEDRAAAIAARDQLEELRQIMEAQRSLLSDVLTLEKRVEKLEAKLESEIDMYIRRLNAASRKYLKAEQARAMELLPGEVTHPNDEAPADLRQMEAFPELTGKAGIRARIKARRAAREASP